MNARGPLRGTYFNSEGQRRTTQYDNPDQLSFLLTAGDLNPFLQAELPAAMSAARRGDPMLLMRLKRIGQGASTKLADLSFGLNVTTGCEDTTLPYPLSTPLAARPAIAQQALAAIPPSDYDPWDGQTVLRTSYVDDCMDWPGDTVRQPFSGPLPNVPALLLGGRLDTRTPVENAFATQRELPQSSVVTLKGSGHDTLDSDITGCINEALRRFIERQPVGNPCKGKNNGVAPVPLPPRSIRDFKSAPGVGGRQGRVVFAVLDTASDARLTALQDLFAGLSIRGGGLRGGWFSGEAAFDGRLSLHDYEYVPGLRVTGSLDSGSGTLTGTLTVSGIAHGTLKLDHRGGVTGTLGGREVHYKPTSSAAAASDGPALAFVRDFAVRRLPVLAR
jgi:hypothetical protein